MKKIFKKINTHKKKIVIILSILLTILTLITSTIILKNNYKQNAQTAKVVSNKNTSDYLIKKNITINTSSELPDIATYFEKASSLRNYTIKYYLDDKEIPLNTFTYSIDGKTYIKGTGNYKVVISGKEEYITNLIITDKQPPEVTVKSISIKKNASYTAKDFISTYKDNSFSTNYTVNFKDKSNSTLTSPGQYNITLTICDESKNCLDKSTKLTIQEDKPSTPTKVTYVKDIQEKRVLSTKNYYGTKVNTYTIVKYQLFSDGSKKQIRESNTKKETIYSTYNGTVKDLKNEAIQTYKSSLSSTTRNTILTESNKYREQVKVDALTIDKELSIMATIRAMEMAFSHKFSHTRPNKEEWSTLFTEYGYQSSPISENSGGIIGENLATGYDTDLGACTGWRNSPKHYENIINGKFRKIGIGKYTFNGETYWVQLFSS